MQNTENGTAQFKDKWQTERKLVAIMTTRGVQPVQCAIIMTIQQNGLVPSYRLIC